MSTGSPVQRIGQPVALLALVLPLVVDIPGLDEPGERMLAVFAMAIVLFVTEAIPLVATAVLIILLEVLLLSEQALVVLPEPVGPARDFYATLADPVIVLFLGGFLIADGAAKYALDRNLAAVILNPFRANSRRALFALMGLTAVLSMFMSNTATAATMFAVLLPLLGALPDDAARTGFALSVPVAANLGGIGTPVGSPPNAIALGSLSTRGETVSFVGWMVATVPLMIVLLLAAWLFLSWRYVPPSTPLALDLEADFSTSRPAVVFYVVAAVTVLLWLTESLHGIPSSTVGFLPVVALLATSVMTGDDLKVLQWPVLWLVAGGIALGNGVGLSGLDQWLVELVDWTVLPVALVVVTVAVLAWALSNVISNSATANLVVPIAIPLALSLGEDSVVLAVVVALACGLAMMLPISTPPNAIAYATGTIRTGHLVVTGLFLGVLGLLLVTLAMPPFWRVVGLGGAS